MCSGFGKAAWAECSPPNHESRGLFGGRDAAKAQPAESGGKTAPSNVSPSPAIQTLSPMANPMRTPIFLCALLASATGAFAQNPDGRSNARAEARAEARADAHGNPSNSSESSHSSHTSTHRIVIENGRTVVDERTEDGRAAPAGRRIGGGFPGGMPALPDCDPEEMLRKLREEVERDVGRGMPTIPLDGKPGRSRDSGSAKDSASGHSSSKEEKSSKHKGSGGKPMPVPPPTAAPGGTSDAGPRPFAPRGTATDPAAPRPKTSAKERGKLMPRPK